MLLIEVKENNGWLSSRWQLTYQTGWDGILKACHSVMKYYDNIEILTDGTVVELGQSVLDIKEAQNLTFRGMSTILNVPIMITFYNQLNVVDVYVAMATEEFSVADYERYNKSLCEYMDSIELAMYR